MTIANIDVTPPEIAQQASEPDTTHPKSLGLLGLSALALSACGGGGSDSDEAPTVAREQAQGVTIGASTKPAAATSSTTVSTDAWRFLTQATFGPTPSDLKTTSTLMSKGYQSWLNEQFARQQPTTTFDLAKLNEKQWGPNGGGVFNMGPDIVCSALWEQFIAGPDQLRQRVAFALSEILVVSFLGGDLGEKSLAVASYHDTLVKGAFGSFRTLVENVAKHPAMGCYLTHLRNERPDDNGRIPDQNFARELMQLFTIGLVKLNMDGTPVLDASNKPIPTYNRFDIQVLSHVFTGWAWSSGNWNEGAEVRNSVPVKWDLMRTPMAPRNEFHATPGDFKKIYDSGANPLLFTASAFTPSGDTQTDLTRALDLLFKHPNIAPFIARQMIQRLVTSNPTPAYVKRVATAFKNTNFSLKALVQAVLLDSDARDLATVQASHTFGKLREPVLRITAALRAMGYSTLTIKVDNVTQPRPVFSLPRTYKTTDGGAPSNLGQGPYQAASVFNFYRPDHVATWSESGKLGLKAPELQATSELDVAAYIRFVASGLGWGIGSDVQLTTPATNVPRTPYPEAPGSTLLNARSILMTYKEEVSLCMSQFKTLPSTAGLDQVRTLALGCIVTPISNKLLGGQMSSGLQTVILDHISSTLNNRRDIDGVLVAARDALTMTMLSAEFVVQK